jgi:hypothetical protein
VRDRGGARGLPGRALLGRIRRRPARPRRLATGLLVGPAGTLWTYARPER